MGSENSKPEVSNTVKNIATIISDSPDFRDRYYENQSEEIENKKKITTPQELVNIIRSAVPYHFSKKNPQLFKRALPQIADLPPCQRNLARQIGGAMLTQVDRGQFLILMTTLDTGWLLIEIQYRIGFDLQYRSLTGRNRTTYANCLQKSHIGFQGWHESIDDHVHQVSHSSYLGQISV